MLKLLNCFLFAQNTDRTAILDKDGTKWSYTKNGWNRIFKPITNCSYFQIAKVVLLRNVFFYFWNLLNLCILWKDKVRKTWFAQFVLVSQDSPLIYNHIFRIKTQLLPGKPSITRAKLCLFSSSSTTIKNFYILIFQKPTALLSISIQTHLSFFLVRYCAKS